MKLHRILLASAAVLLALSPAGAQSRQELVFVGSGSSDIEAFRFDAATGALKSLGRAAKIEHPSFLCVSPDHRIGRL